MLSENGDKYWGDFQSLRACAGTAPPTLCVGILSVCFENWGLNIHTMCPGNSAVSPALKWIQTLLQVAPPILRLVPQNWNSSWECLPSTGRVENLKQQRRLYKGVADQTEAWSGEVELNKAQGDLQTSTNKHFQRKWKPVRTRIIMD